jgi:predicted acetyltransferase
MAISLGRVAQKVDGLLEREGAMWEKIKKLEAAEEKRKKKRSSYSKKSKDSAITSK